MLHDPKCRFDYPLALIRLHHAGLFSLDCLSRTPPINTKLRTTFKGFKHQTKSLPRRKLYFSPLTKPRTKRVTTTQAASRTVDPPPNYVRNIQHFVDGTWQHGYAQAWTKLRKVYVPYNVRQCHWVAVEIDLVRHTVTVYDSYTAFTSNTMLGRYMEPITHMLAQVLYEMRFYEKSEVEAVNKKGIDMSKFTPFSICRIPDVPQQTDGTSRGIMTIKFIEYLSAGIPFHTIDPSKFGYYRLKLAIEAFRGEAGV
ncbi:unnamed protein product [Prunus armeniaca]